MFFFEIVGIITFVLVIMLAIITAVTSTLSSKFNIKVYKHIWDDSNESFKNGQKDGYDFLMAIDIEPLKDSDYFQGYRKGVVDALDDRGKELDDGNKEIS